MAMEREREMLLYLGGKDFYEIFHGFFEIAFSMALFMGNSMWFYELCLLENSHGTQENYMMN